MYAIPLDQICPCLLESSRSLVHPEFNRNLLRGPGTRHARLLPPPPCPLVLPASAPSARPLVTSRNCAPAAPNRTSSSQTPERLLAGALLHGLLPAPSLPSACIRFLCSPQLPPWLPVYHQSSPRTGVQTPPSEDGRRAGPGWVLVLAARVVGLTDRQNQVSEEGPAPGSAGSTSPGVSSPACCSALTLCSLFAQLENRRVHCAHWGEEPRPRRAEGSGPALQRGPPQT